MNKYDRFVNPTIESLDEISGQMNEFFRLGKKMFPGHEIFEDDYMEIEMCREMIENKIDRLEGDINE